MRVFTLAIITFAVAISANASLTQKREVSSTFKICSENIAKDMNFLDSLDRVAKGAPNPDILDYTIADLIEEEKTRQLNADVIYCCQHFESYTNGEDLNAVPAFLSSTINTYSDIVWSLVIRKGFVDSFEELYNLTERVMPNAKSSINELLNCFISKPLANRTPAETALFNKLKKANSDFKSAYGF